MAVKFFISYKRDDAETERLLTPLRAALKKFGYEVFVDVDNIELGAQWEAELRRNIECADEFLLLLSPAAASSERVEDEVRIADTFRHSKNRKPRILPIYINLVDPQEPALKRVLDPVEHLTWRNEADTPEILARIRAMVRRRRRPGVIATATAVAVALLLVAGFGHSMSQVARLRNVTSSVADILAAYRRLRTDQRMLVPRLWLVGRWKPETLAADALDAHALPLLASTNRHDMDQGLLLSAQAAVMRGGEVAVAAQRAYEAESYELLISSVDARDEIAGRALAAVQGSAEWRIAVGGRIWRCSEPIGEQVCSVFPRSSRQSVVVASAFDSGGALWLVAYSGEMTKLDLRSGDEPSVGTQATCVAADRGDVATSFDHGRDRGGSSVVVDLAARSLRPQDSGDLGRVKMLAFGPCDDCVSTLGVDGVVKIWRWSSLHVQPLILTGKALALAATRTGHRLAVVNSAGALEYYGTDGRPDGERPVIDLTGVESMAISPDARHVAVVHDGNVTIFEKGAAFWPLISAIRKPRPIAVLFAGNDYLVTRTPSDARIWRLRSARRPGITPYQRWMEWRTKLGFPVVRVVAGQD